MSADDGAPEKKDLEKDEPTPTFDYAILGKTTNRFYDVRWLVILKDKIVSTICFFRTDVDVYIIK